MKSNKVILMVVAALAGLVCMGVASALGFDVTSSGALGLAGVGMATNYVKEGDVLTLTAPYTVTSGQGAQIGSQFGVALADITNATAGEFATSGVWDLTALSTATGAQGAKVYWDNSNRRVDTDGTVGILIGVLETAKTNGQTTARVKLNEAVVGTSEGPQAAIANFTDSTGAGANDATLADGLTATALTENAGALGGTNDGDLPDLTATVVVLDNVIAASADAQQDIESCSVADGTMGGAADGTLETVGATNGGDVSGAIMNNFKDVQAALAVAKANDATLAVAVNQLVADNIALRAAVREVANRVNTCITDLTTQNQNDSDIAAKVNVLLGELRTFGVIAAA